MTRWAVVIAVVVGNWLWLTACTASPDQGSGPSGASEQIDGPTTPPPTDAPTPALATDWTTQIDSNGVLTITDEAAWPPTAVAGLQDPEHPPTPGPQRPRDPGGNVICAIGTCNPDAKLTPPPGIVVTMNTEMTLFYLNAWQPDPAGIRSCNELMAHIAANPNSCRTVDTYDLCGSCWQNWPPASAAAMAAAVVVPSSLAWINPPTNPQVATIAGQGEYSWDAATGNCYVVAGRRGNVIHFSPPVGVTTAGDIDNLHHCWTNNRWQCELCNACN